MQCLGTRFKALADKLAIAASIAFGLSMAIASTPLSAASLTEPPNIIKIQSDDWCPYVCDINGKNKGFLVDIAIKVFTDAGFHVEYSTVNWSRAIANARQGKTDAVLGAFRGDVPDFVFPQHKLGQSINRVLVKSGSSFSFQSIADLTAIRIGIIQ